jgi:hypothetical protein
LLKPGVAHGVKYDESENTVSVGVKSLNPCGSAGIVGVFAGLPIETVDERTVTVKPGSSGGIVKGAGSVILTPGSRGAYLSHKIEIPNYVSASPSDPQCVVIKIRTAMLAERYSMSGGVSFPTQSGAVFVVNATDAYGQPVQFTSPVNLTVQYMDRSDPAQTDRVSFNGRVASPDKMRVVWDKSAGAGVDFAFVGSPSQTVDPAQGTVTVQNLVGLTGSDGCGTFGAVALGNTTPAARWRSYP